MSIHDERKEKVALQQGHVTPATGVELEQRPFRNVAAELLKPCTNCGKNLTAFPWCSTCMAEAETPPTATIKDSGYRRSFSTGSQRDAATGKGRYDLLPIRALHILAKHFEAGCSKYGSRNWELGQPLSVYMNSGLRHANKHLLGLRDEPHLEAAIWNFLALLDTKERIEEGLLPKELDDLPAPLTNIPKCFL